MTHNKNCHQQEVHNGKDGLLCEWCGPCDCKEPVNEAGEISSKDWNSLSPTPEAGTIKSEEDIEWERQLIRNSINKQLRPPQPESGTKYIRIDPEALKKASFGVKVFATGEESEDYKLPQDFHTQPESDWEKDIRNMDLIVSGAYHACDADCSVDTKKLVAFIRTKKAEWEAKARLQRTNEVVEIVKTLTTCRDCSGIGEEPCLVKTCIPKKHNCARCYGSGEIEITKDYLIQALTDLSAKLKEV